MKPKATKKAQPKRLKQKSLSKKMQTFNSSQFSLWEQKTKAIHGSVKDLIRQGISSRQFCNASTLSQYNPSKGNTTKLPAKKKKKNGSNTKSKTKIKKIDLEEFQKAKYKQSNSHSQIIFSNDETKRESCISRPEIKNVKCVQSICDFKPDTNLILRGNIKKEFIRKTEAATKIQKVFRGFMTRKILMKYVVDEEYKLKSKSRLQFDEVRQNDTHRTFVDKQGENLMSRLFDGNLADVDFNHTIRPRAEDFADEPDWDENTDTKQPLHLSLPRRKEDVRFNFVPVEGELQSNSDAEQSSYSEEEDEDSSTMYRRQNPIYSQQEISHYLESSEQEDEEADTYEPDIIFETNQQYLESRKSSLQNREVVNKLSNKGLSEIASLLDGAEEHRIRKELREDHTITVQREREELVEELQEVGKRQEFNHRQIAEKQRDNDEPSQPVLPQNKNVSIETHEDKRTKVQNQKLRPQASPRRDVKYLDQQSLEANESEGSAISTRSKNEVDHEEIIRLKQQQKEKWEEIIQMVSQQIRKSQESSGEISNFMHTIMQFSQKNKEMLGSTRSFNSQSEAFTTPTSTGMAVKSNVDQTKRLSKLNKFQDKKEDQNNVLEYDDNSFKFFKKKKPLKIAIAGQEITEGSKQFPQFSGSKIQNSLNIQPEGEQQFDKQKIFIRNSKSRQNFSLQKKHQTLPNPDTESKSPNNLIDNLDKTQNIKRFLSSNIQVQDSAIEDILKLREELLLKRQSEDLMKLNQLLRAGKLTQQGFLERLTFLTKKFSEEKQAIDRAKQDIIKGYQAANDLVREYFFDVRRMGIKLAVSRSQDNLKYKLSQPLFYTGEIKIDELTPKSTPHTTPKSLPNSKKVANMNVFEPHEIIEEEKSKQKQISQPQSLFESSEDSSMDFTEEELKRFRKAANYDLQFTDLNRNMTTISDDFVNQQRKSYSEQNSLSQTPERNLKELQPHKETYHLEQDKIPERKAPAHVDQVIEAHVSMLVWEFASEILIKPSISEKFIERSSFARPLEISNNERMEFLRTLQSNLPQVQSIHRKLNQNITPLPSEILKCMRLDFSEEDRSEEDNEDNMQEVNKYEFVISQESCAKSIMLFKNSVEQMEEKKEIEQIRKTNQLHSKCREVIEMLPEKEKVYRVVEQREKFLKNKKQRTRELRWEVMNIELHCIFDSWNEEIIQICSSRPGFSGIGLNELTLSMTNHNKRVPVDRALPIVREAKAKIEDILLDDTDVSAKILKENFHEMCETDSAWIFYADEALSYALELVYLVEEDLYTEIAKQMRKIIVKSAMLG